MFGNHSVSLSSAQSNGPPPAFASDPLVHMSASGGRGKSKEDLLDSTKDSTTDIVEIDGPSSRGNQVTSDHGSNFMKSSSPAPVGGFSLKFIFLLLYTHTHTQSRNHFINTVI